jgi:glutaredoxin
MNKLAVKVFVKGNKENWCSKCYKTKELIDNMIQELPEFQNKVDLMYKDVTSNETREKYGELDPPVIFIDEKIFSEGRIPTIKKLKQSIREAL